MKIAVVFLAALLAVAPTVAACACPSTPSEQRMGCEGTSHCCCGDSPNQPPSHDGCPRSQGVVDTLDQPSSALPGSPELPADVVASFPADPAPALGFVARAVDEGGERRSPSRPLFLLCSVLLL